MDEILELFLTGQRAFTDRVHAIGDRWHAPTPAGGWTVADLVDHLISEHRWLPPLLHGLDLASAEEVVQGTRDLPVDGGVGANHAELWDEAAAASADAVIAPGVLDRTVDLSRGTTPAPQYLTEMTVDLCIHAWDLGRSVGHLDPLPAPLVTFALEQVGRWGDLSGWTDPSGATYFAAPVPVADDASDEDRLVAVSGRDPQWSPPG